MPISQKLTKVITCVGCGATQEVDRQEYWNTDTYICSDKCRAKCQQEVLDKNYQDNVEIIIPPKFRDIECDKKHLIRLGLDQSVFITGNAGRGKTVLMAAMVKTILKEQTQKVMWISYPEFIITVQGLYWGGKENKSNDKTPDMVINEVAKYRGILAIDDLGAEKLTDFVRQTTYFIFNHREQNLLRTLVTSNFSLQQIDDQVDSRISSRIAGMCKIVELTGADRRLEKKQGK